MVVCARKADGKNVLSGAVEMPNGEWVVVGRTSQWDGFSPEPYQMFLLHLDANGMLLEEKSGPPTFRWLLNMPCWMRLPTTFLSQVGKNLSK